MRQILCCVSLLALAACAGEAGRPPETFGSAVEANAQLMAGERDAAVALGQRFAAEVEETVTFAFDSAALDARARATLARQAAFIRQFPEVRFSVTGHADRVGGESYNYGLGLRRARAAVAYLVAQGVDESRLQALVSEGETMPVVPTDGPERANRRTVTTVSGFVQGRGGVLNGQYAAVIYREYVASATAASTVGSGTSSTGGSAGGGAASPSP